MSKARDVRRIETILVHGRGNNSGDAGPTLPPVTFSTAFSHGSAEEMEAVFSGRGEGHYYSRMQNPSVEALEARISESCGAAGSLALASGMSAITLGLLGLLRSGDELLASPYLFGGSYTLFTRTFKDLGITVRFIDPGNPAAAEALITERTRGVFLEAIANPAMVVPDFAAFRAVCDRHGLPLLVDASLLTPYLFDAQALGADLAFFSATKYLAGPASVVAGVIVDTGRFPWHDSKRFDFSEYRKAGQGAYLARLRLQLMAAIGPALSPMTAFLLQTGLETLPLRMDRMCESALTVAAFLREHPKVREVHFPGLPDHPTHSLSREQFRGRFGSVLSFSLADRQACFRLLDRLRVILRATNLGDTRSLAIHPASTIYGTFWKHEQEEMGVTEGLIRLSVGIEHVEDLITDLRQGLAAA